MKKIFLMMFVFLAHGAFAFDYDYRNILDCELDCTPSFYHPHDQEYNTPCCHHHHYHCARCLASTLGLGGGYRQDTLEWKTFSPFFPQTSLREKWNHIPIAVAEATANLLFCDHLLFVGDVDYGWVRGGKHHFKNKDISHHRTLQNLSSTTKGYVWDLSGGAGYQFNSCCNTYSFAPIVGYSSHQQTFKNHHYRDHLFKRKVFAISRNTFRWFGPWVGFCTSFQECGAQFYFSYLFHWINYRAKIREFLGIPTQNQKKNELYGNEFIVGINFKLCHFWTGFKVDAKFFNGGRHGHSKTASTKTSLRNLSWNNYTFTWDIGYSF